MGPEPRLACAGERSRCPRAPGEKASADLKKLQQIFTVVQLASNLRDNWSRTSKMKYVLIYFDIFSPLTGGRSEGLGAF